MYGFVGILYSPGVKFVAYRDMNSNCKFYDYFQKKKKKLHLIITPVTKKLLLLDSIVFPNAGPS